MTHEWTADDVLSMARGYQRSCVLAAAVELDVFTVLGADRGDAETIARRAGADVRGMTILLDALAALGLLTKHDGVYEVPESLRPLLCDGAGDGVLAMTRHQANCMRRWMQLAQVVRSGQPAVRSPSIRGEEADRAAFIEAMNDINRAVARPLVEELGITDFEHLLDVGGASGTWTMAWLDMNPRARATLFDLPHVVPLADARLRERGYSERVRLVAGDFAVDQLPGGADLAWVSAIVHQHSRAENRALFERIHAALTAGGRMLIRDIVMDGSRIAPVGGALFAVNMLVGTSGGGTFTFDELAEDLAAAGFGSVRQLRSDQWMHSIVLARKHS
jgi:precorrin-6B methylase 2